jgi:predicted O-linked N-acetylglucosamine transferase (SPINDLY family)
MWLNLARACLRQSNWAGAADALATVMELDPQSALGREMSAEVFGRWLLASNNLARDLKLLPAHLLSSPQFLTGVANTIWAAARPADAVTVLFQALAAKLDYVPAHELLIYCMRDMDLKAEATECAKTVLALEPHHLPVRMHLLFDQRGACDWEELDQRMSALKADLERMEESAAQPLPVFGLLSMSVSPQLQRRAAAAASRYCSQGAAVFSRPAHGPRKPGVLRIGFLSADFKFHPVAQLVTEFIEQLDRTRCQVHLYAHGRPDDSSWRQRLQSAADVFADLGDESDGVIAHRIRADDVDVLVELGGHTRGTRLGVLALRPAPVQATYLGYPGTTGHEHIDYLIGDPVVTPLESADQYSECIAQLPGCLMPGSRHRPSVRPITRQSLGLPEDGFVICALNQPYKLLPETFDIWCEVLRDAPNAVLWLTSPNVDVVTNLRAEAVERGVDPGRLIFAQRASYEDYFSRFAAADLFVDTWPYGAHTTASDALWAGLPVLTLEGPGFASRVGSSLMRSVGLSEFVCPDVATYKDRLIAHVRNPQGMLKVRQDLVARRDDLALFDSKRFADNFLGVIELMHQRRLQGHAPSQIAAPVAQ